MKRVLAIIAVGLLLGGCATQTWSKPGATAQVYERDAVACDREADRGAYAANAPGHVVLPTHGARHPEAAVHLSSLRRIEHEERFAACIAKRGYTKAN